MAVNHVSSDLGALSRVGESGSSGIGERMPGAGNDRRWGWDGDGLAGPLGGGGPHDHAIRCIWIAKATAGPR